MTCPLGVYTVVGVQRQGDKWHCRTYSGKEETGMEGRANHSRVVVGYS